MLEMTSKTRYRLRRIDRAPDDRTKSYASREEAETARDRVLSAKEAASWEIVPQTSGPSGARDEAARSKVPRTFTLAPEVWETVGRLALSLGLTKTRVVENAVRLYDEKVGTEASPRRARPKK
ncbi:MAG TPA: hypothetical protein VGI39_01360 [Polyangiaceae bacterium]|jgi:hypothetical protein